MIDRKQGEDLSVYFPDWLGEQVEMDGETMTAREWLLEKRSELTEDEYKLRRSAGWEPKPAIVVPRRATPAQRAGRSPGRLGGNASKDKEMPRCPWRGVTWHKSAKMWYARLFNQGVMLEVGYYHRHIDAAIAYNLVARSRLGPNARLNEV